MRAPASTVTNVRAAYRITPSTEVSLDIFNLFDRKLDDIQYAYASRLPGEAAYSEGVTPNTIHVHPSLPRTLRVGVKIGF